MKKVSMLLLMCAASLLAVADDFVWTYSTDKRGNPVACICSSIKFPDGDYTKGGTILGMFVGQFDGKECVDIILGGDYTMHDLDESRKYVVVDIGGKKQRWRVEFVEFQGSKFNRLRFVNSSRMIDYLVEADDFSITLPIYKQGATTFYFSCNSYPLDW